jgi:hypothetical protein
MAHKRNTAGLARAAQDKSKAVTARAEAAIKALQKRRAKITFTAVASEAKVSTAWLYRQPEMAERIKRLRDDQERALPKPVAASQAASDTSKDAMIKVLRERIRTQDVQIQELKKQLEVAYGLLHDKD